MLKSNVLENYIIQIYRTSFRLNSFQQLIMPNNNTFLIVIAALMLFTLTNSLLEPCPDQITTQVQLLELQPRCFRKLYDTEAHDGHMIYKIINQRLASYKRLLQDLKMVNVQHLKTHPVIRWAQNQSHIFLNLRLSHRHDSPTCSDIRSQKFSSDVFFVSGDLTIENVKSQEQQTNQSVKQSQQANNNTNENQTQTSTIKSRFNMECECYFTNQKLLFNLHLKFKATLLRLNIKREGFGTYTLIGEKLVPQIWIDPFNDVRKAGIWSQIRQKYEKDMNKYFQLLEAATQNKPSKVKKKYRNKIAKKQDAQAVQATNTQQL